MKACVVWTALTVVLVGMTASATEPSPLGRLVDIGGRSLHLYCTGAGLPVIVLEAGIGGNHLDWLRVQPLLSGATTVCSYDRAGYGWSDRGPKPRTTRVIAAELRALLAAAGEPPPYLMVGHSFGGLIARVFASDEPQETAGVVLVDAMVPEQYSRFAEVGVEVAVTPTRAVIYSSPDVLAYGIPEPFRRIAYDLARSEKSRSFMYNELRNVLVSIAEARADRPPSGLPSAVIVHGDRQWDRIYPDGRMEDAWLDLQMSAARELGAGPPIVLPKAGHQAPLDDPDGVSAVILGVLDQVRNRRGATRP